MAVRQFRSWVGLTVVALVVTACGSTATPAPTTDATASGPAGSQAGSAPGASFSGEKVTISIESWRTDDQSQWDEQIIPAFEATHPNITVKFNPTAAGDYDAALTTRLQSGAAGDIITCRGFDVSLAMYTAGNLTSLNDLPGIENFSDTAKVAWQTDDRKTTFCVPMGSYPAGFYYNQDVFAELGLTPPTTWADFTALLQKIKDGGKYVPLGIGTKDQWESGDVLFGGIGPNYWQGETGRLALIAGALKMTDQPFVDALKALGSLSPFLPSGASAQTYADSQNSFTLGKAAIYPGGSWEIANFEKQATFKIGYFRAPLKDSSQTTCYVQNQPGQGAGLNPKSANPAAAKAFLTWLSTSDASNVMAKSLVGALPMANVKVDITNPLAQAFQQNTLDCQNTIRLTYQVLSRGTPNFTTDLFTVTSGVLGGSLDPAAGAQKLQDSLASWYQPQK